jgi:hypothetical protein
MSKSSKYYKSELHHLFLGYMLFLAQSLSIKLCAIDRHATYGGNMINKAIKCSGNARALAQLSECENLFSEYTVATAAEITARACHRGGFTKVKAEHIPLALELIRALRSPNVDVHAEREIAERKAEVACAELISVISHVALDESA